VLYFGINDTAQRVWTLKNPIFSCISGIDDENVLLSDFGSRTGSSISDILCTEEEIFDVIMNLAVIKLYFQVRLCVGVFQGPDPLCSIVDTKEVFMSQDGLCSFNDIINFDIKVQDLPQTSRLCFGLNTKKGKVCVL
jgi:hypothetical protein